ncbi:hypothetical protein ABZY03_04635 [Streptomyces klenkii]|uniref:hypothetical protein n=1 Tax=Streptomyces klenkii TaxID=1420899 RepID=UPI0033B1A3D1
MTAIANGQIAKPGVIVPLVERRRAGEAFPRVPVGGFELTREQVAVAVYVWRHQLPKLPSTEELLEACEEASAALLPSGLDRLLPELEAYEPHGAVRAVAWGYAYRLCLAHWYENAISEYIGLGAMMAALYASDIKVERNTSAHGRSAYVDGHLMEGISRIGAARAVELGASWRLEFGPPWNAVPLTQLPAGYLSAMPNRRRRRFCENIATNRQSGARPLMVQLNSGEYAVGITPPPCPHDVALFGRAVGLPLPEVTR